MTSSQQELPGKLEGGETASILCLERLQCCCVWPMCVSEDKTCGSAQ